MTTYYSQAIAGCFVADESRATILDNPRLSLNDPGTWEQILGTQIGTESGVNVTPQKALTCAALWQAVSVISQDVARMRLMVNKIVKDGTDQRLQPLPDHELSWRLGWAPNDEESAVDFWQRVMTHVLLWSNAYIYIAADGSLMTLLPDRTRPDRADGLAYYVTEVGGRLEPIPFSRVMHIKGLTIDGAADLVWLQQARNAIGLALAQESFASKFFKYGGRVGGILELPAGMSKPTRDAVEEGFRKTYGEQESAFKTVILRENAKFHEAQTSPADMQLVEGTEQEVRQIARFYNLPASKLNLKDSTAYNALEQANQAYLDQTLSIWLAKITAQCELRLLTPREQALYQIKHDTSDMLRMDPMRIIQFGQIGVASKITTPNEVRTRLGMAPIDGGDKFEEPQPSATAKQPAADQPPQQANSGDAGQPAELDDVTLVKRRLVYAIAYRARAKARNASAFVQWIDSRFKDHRDEWNTVTGGMTEPEFFVEFHSALSKLADTTTAANLAERVDELVTNWERSY